jgi:DNA-binding NtrC family response regulator
MSENNKAEQDAIWDMLDFFNNQVEPIGLTDEIARLEETRIREALKEYNNNKTHAARNLGIGRTLLIHKIKKYEIGAEIETRFQ